jgi:hypothetical protein
MMGLAQLLPFSFFLFFFLFFFRCKWFYINKDKMAGWLAGWL